MGGIKERVDWFRQNLDLLLEDRRLRREGNATEIFFDTDDYTSTILGMYRFYRPNGGFDVERFDQPPTLVQSLAAAGWLGKIRILPPHKVEFLNLLQRDFGLGGRNEDPRAVAERFLAAVNVRPPFRGRLEELGNLSDEDRHELIRRSAGSPQRLFKAIQCISGTWRTRLLAWRDRGMLDIDAESFDPTAILGSEIYQRAKRRLDDKRPRLTVNNFTDALTIALLVSRLNDFREGKSRFVPLFFDHGGLLHDVVREAELESHLTYEGLDGRPVLVMRDADYFLLRATFGRREPEDGQDGELDRFRDIIEEIDRAQQPLAESTVRAIDKEQPVIELIDDLRKLRFFENVWLRYWPGDQQAAFEELDRAARNEAEDLREAVTQLGSETFREGVKEAIREVEEALGASVAIYREVRSVWRAVQKPVRKLRELRKAEGRRFRASRDLGLLRFSLPAETEQEIAGVLLDLSSNTGNQAVEAQERLLGAFFRAEDGKDRTFETLAFLSGVLWTADLYLKIVDLLAPELGDGTLPGHHHFSLPLLYGAALVRDCETRDNLSDDERRAGAERALRVLEMLERRFQAEEDGVRRAELALGLASLNFHLFLLSRRLGLGEPRRLRDRSIELAGLAWSSLTDEEKRVYALHQCLYYRIEGFRGEAMSDPEIFRAAERLLSYQKRTDLWQYRYDDTLARHFERLALASGDRLDWNQARLHLDRALEASSGDPDVIAYASELTNRFNAWRFSSDQRP